MYLHTPTLFNLHSKRPFIHYKKYAIVKIQMGWIYSNRNGKNIIFFECYPLAGKKQENIKPILASPSPPLDSLRINDLKAKMPHCTPFDI